MMVVGQDGPAPKQSPRGVLSTRGHGEKRMTATLAPSVAQHAPTFTIAHLRTAYATMIAAHPEQDSRLQRALAIVVAAEIERFISRGDAWQIQSLSDPGTYYVVTMFD